MNLTMEELDIGPVMDGIHVREGHLLWLMPPESYGATPDTLKLRASYGGRKGRRAAQRLAVLPKPASYVVTHVGSATEKAILTRR
jgi:hypothetical protein